MSPRRELLAAPKALFSHKARWKGIDDIPPGFTDGTDDDALGLLDWGEREVAKRIAGAWACSADEGVTSVTAGNGLLGGGTAPDISLEVALAGSGSANSVARSDHNHFGQRWVGAVGVGLSVASNSASGMFGQTNASSSISSGVLGVATATTGMTRGVEGRSLSDRGIGVSGLATASIGTTYGVRGDSLSNSGIGVFGLGDRFGVEGQARRGHGVIGRALSTGSFADSGVHGVSGAGAGRGVSGPATARTGNTSGVHGESRSELGNCVSGIATSRTGNNYGVYGATASPIGFGVAGWAEVIRRLEAQSYGSGLYGESDSGAGVTGRSTVVRGNGVQAFASQEGGVGLYAESRPGSGWGGYLRNTTGPVLYLDSGARPARESRPLDTPVGAYLSLGGAWTNRSDAQDKENFETIDGAQILEKIARLPISSWNYKADGPAERHIGPTAQDFKAVFGLGDGHSIATIDPSGIALAAIKDLIRATRELEKQGAALEAMQLRLTDLKARLRRDPNRGVGVEQP